VQIRVSTRHGNLSDESREKITAKAEKLTRFFERLTDIEVVVDLQDAGHPHVDLKVSAEHKHDFTASAKADELMAAIELAEQKMEQQLRKYKEKLQGRGRKKDARLADIEPHNED
jgi:putative sigma-54 modulation protein